MDLMGAARRDPACQVLNREIPKRSNIPPMSLEKVAGYFTIERHLVSADVGEITRKLGFPPSYLLHGARILVIVEKIDVGEFLFAGSTWYPDEDGNPKGLVS